MEETDPAVVSGRLEMLPFTGGRQKGAKCRSSEFLLPFNFCQLNPEDVSALYDVASLFCSSGFSTGTIRTIPK